jgi:hypothetical protein
MLSFSAYAHLRYVLLLNALAGLGPALLVKGHANDPLLTAPWWSSEYHSGVLAVCLAAVAASILVGLLLWRGIRRRWPYVLCSVFAGLFPGLFYLVATPSDHLATVPVSQMLLTGCIWGLLIGVPLLAALGKSNLKGEPRATKA